MPTGGTPLTGGAIAIGARAAPASMARHRQAKIGPQAVVVELFGAARRASRKRSLQDHRLAASRCAPWALG
jgi:hypothetical protein